tara:strand:+ start:908 stop:1363 length:456 start_codon:yes stop_codon:yes gene_type:complete
MKIRKGFRKQRVVRPKEKDVPVTYDSKWEYSLHQGVLKDWGHHGDKIEYTIDHVYHPDFIKKIGEKTIYIEAKGRFWDYQEYNKYTWVKKSLPPNTELIFLFANPYAPMPQAKKRKDGTKRSHAEWAEANSFKWYTEDSVWKLELRRQDEH